MPSILLRFLLCVTLVLNGIGSAAASAWVMDAHSEPDAAGLMLDEAPEDCAHAADSDAAGHGPASSPSLVHEHTGHETDECAEICLEKCLNLYPAVVAPQPGLHALDKAASLVPRNEMPAHSILPVSPMRPPIG